MAEFLLTAFGIVQQFFISENETESNINLPTKNLQIYRTFSFRILDFSIWI